MTGFSNYLTTIRLASSGPTYLIAILRPYSLGESVVVRRSGRDTHDITLVITFIRTIRYQSHNFCGLVALFNRMAAHRNG